MEVKFREVWKDRKGGFGSEDYVRESRRVNTEIPDVYETLEERPDLFVRGGETGVKFVIAACVDSDIDRLRMQEWTLRALSSHARLRELLVGVESNASKEATSLEWE